MKEIFEVLSYYKTVPVFLRKERSGVLFYSMFEGSILSLFAL